MTLRLLRIPLLAVVPFLLATCGGPDNAGDGPAYPTWITEPEFRISGSPERDVIFVGPYVRVDPFRDRILVMDGGASQVSAWTPEGELLFVAGRRGEGPGEFVVPQDLLVEPDGFTVLSGYGSKFARFDAHGKHQESFLGPGTSISFQGFLIDFAFPRKGTHVGVPRIGSHRISGAEGGPAVDRYPLVSARRSGNGQWGAPIPLFTLDRRNMVRTVPIGKGRLYGSQRFGDADIFRLLPGSAVIVRRRGDPGSAQLLEIDGAGDTLWHRHLQFEPRKLTPQMIENHVNDAMNSLLPDVTQMSSAVSARDFRRDYRETLYTPEYLPVARNLLVTHGAREVWLATHEREDTLAVWRVVPGGDGNEPPRQVLLPEGMRMNDATETHVWGVYRDELDVPHVVGRRLVPPAGR